MEAKKLYSYIDLPLKIFLLSFGLADFFGMLDLLTGLLHLPGGSLDIFDKLLTSALLLYFWYKLRPSEFMVGKRSAWLDLFILAGFYMMSLNIYLRFIEGYDNALAGLVSYAAISYYINILSVSVGPLLLLLVSIYAGTRMDLGDRSVMRSLICFFSRKEKSWDEIKKRKNMHYAPLRIFVCFIGLYLIANYFFMLVSQWLIVSLDKSLLVVAILFAAKDLRSKKIEAIDRIGNFDDVMFGTITRLFTDPKLAYLGFGFLLIFHYLSDISIFFLPYLTHFIGMETGFYGLDAETHQTLYTLFASETATGGFELFAMSWTYILSGIGIAAIILIPIVLMFFSVFEVGIMRLERRIRFQIPFLIVLVSVLVFVIGPWVDQAGIRGSEVGVYGVDFVSHRISEALAFTFVGMFIISLIILTVGLIAWKKHVSEIITVCLYIVSMSYLGLYCWNFFSSALEYYRGSISYFASQNDYALVLVLRLLCVLDFLFYIGVFLILSYFLSRYLIRNVMAELLSSRFIAGWSISVIAISIYLIWLITKSNLVSMTALLFSFLASTLIFSLAFYHELLGKKEYRDDFILASNLIILLYLVVGIAVYLLETFFSLDEGITNFIVPMIVSAAALAMLWFFGLKVRFEISVKKLLISLGLGLFFGLAFAALGEPITPIFSDRVLWIVIFIAFVAFSEEAIFRHVLFKLTERSFSYAQALVIQSVIFSLMHFLILRNVILHFKGSILLTLLYFILLFAFGLVMGMLVGKEEKKGEDDLIYPMAAHFLADIVLYIAIAGLM